MTSTEPGTGAFPTMGTSAAELKMVGRPERGRERPRGTGGKGGSDIPGTGDKKNRGASYERMGASLHPTATLYEANAASATEGQKHVLQMPSRGSWTDNFRAKSTYGRTLS
jgi:hypothetical protein